MPLVVTQEQFRVTPGGVGVLNHLQSAFCTCWGKHKSAGYTKLKVHDALNLYPWLHRQSVFVGRCTRQMQIPLALRRRLGKQISIFWFEIWEGWNMRGALSRYTLS